MTKAHKYLKDFHLPNDEKLLQLIKKVQEDTIKETVEECSKNLFLIGSWQEPNYMQTMGYRNTVSFVKTWELKALNLKVRINIETDKNHVLSVAEKLIKKL
jgi:hypothetical protein